MMVKEAKDPICGMTVNIKDAKRKKLFAKNNYFCSKSCMDKFLNKKVPFYRSETFAKIFPYFLGVVLVGMAIISYLEDFMVTYMGIFFLVFSFMKVLDWKGFVDAFSNYDLISKNIRLYGWVYPGIEIVLGILFLTNSFIIYAAWVTLFIMGIGAIGVTIKLLKKEKFQCACLGTKINVPLTKVTLLEDILMAGMAAIILFFQPLL